MTRKNLDIDNLERPIKRTTGDTLEDRLTGNAYYNILPERYLRQTSDGDLDEQQENLFPRVAKNVALAEVVYEAEQQGQPIKVSPEQVHQNKTNRDEVVEQLFDTSATLNEEGELVVEDESEEIELTEENVNKFSYDLVVPELENEDIIEHVRSVREDFEELMSNLKFIPNSPTLMNAGDHLQQLSACFVMSPDDDIDDIHETAKNAAKVFQSGGGCGYGFWDLRPYGDAVGGTGGIASGPITFMRTYDQLCETIAQGGTRRGAQMGVMRISHPDVIQFIHSKNKDVSLAHTLRLNDPDDYTHNKFKEALEEARELIDDEGRVPKHLRNAVEGHLSNFNISVGVTDDFMEAYKNGDDFTFTNPRTDEPHIATEETKELYDLFGLGEYVEAGEVLEIPAEEIWDRIISGAHENGEPGVIYLERANKKHSFDVDENPEYRMRATNPCVAEGTLVNTPTGYRPVEEVEEGDNISTVIGSEEVDEIETHTDYNVYKVNFSDGGSMKVTAQHKFHVIDGKKVKEIPLHQLEPGDTIRKHPASLSESGTESQYEEQLNRGLLIGDEYYTKDKIDTHKRAATSNSGEKRFNETTRGKIQSGQEMVTEFEHTTGKSVDVTDFSTTKEVIGFLDGILAANGSINFDDRPKVRWKTSSEELAEDIQNLLNLVGMHACIETPKSSQKMPECELIHTVTISGSSANKFADKSNVGEVDPDKEDKLSKIQRDYITEENTCSVNIESVEAVGETTTVYDLYCSGSDTWITKGYVQQGCGEQPLMEFEACNLGHINLSTLVDTDATDWRLWSDENLDDYDSLESAIDAYMRENLDLEEFDRRIELGTRFLENVVTMSDFPVDKISETVRKNRKIGLGIMGLAQMFVQLGVKYGEEVSTEMARWTMTHINHGSKDESHNLALERGAFENWGDSKYADPTRYSDWFEHHTGKDPSEWESGYPVRNHNTTTIAPTGCVQEDSLISTTDGLQKIKDIGKTDTSFGQWRQTGDELQTITDTGNENIRKAYDNSIADVVSIETSEGFEISATPNHRFRVFDEEGNYVWKEAKDFKSGDNIVLVRNTFDSTENISLNTVELDENQHHNTADDLTLPETMSEELAEFLGYYMGNGYVHENVGVKYVTDSTNEELESYLTNLCESVFGVTPTVENRGSRNIFSVGGRHLPRYFEDNNWKKDSGNEGEGAASAFIPNEVLESEKTCVEGFLRGLFEADGTASRKVELSTVSDQLAKDVQTSLLSLGVVFVKDKTTADEMGEEHYGERDVLTLRGANKREDKKFMEEIGFITKSNEYELTNRSFKNDSYPQEVMNHVTEIDGFESLPGKVKKRVRSAKWNGSLSRRAVRDVEQRLGEVVTLDGRVLTDLYTATVESTTEGQAYTRDVEVPSTNTYTANGFVSHNTTSMVGNTTGGCEPMYNVAYYKNVSDDVQGDEMLVEFDDYFLRTLEANDIDVQAVKEEAAEQMSNNEFNGIEGLDRVPDTLAELFVTTGDVSAKEHANIQCACQDGVDSAISKTINAPNDASVEETNEAFLQVWENGGKGVTYFRDGTRSKQVLTTRADNTTFSDVDEDAIDEILDALEENEELRKKVKDAISTTEPEYLDTRERPDRLEGNTQRIETGYGKVYVTINTDPETDEPFELFANIGQSGGYTNSFTEALAKVISIALRSGVDPDEITNELKGTRSPKLGWDNGEQIHSIPDAIGRALDRTINDQAQNKENETQNETTTDSTSNSNTVNNLLESGESPECPDCGGMSLYYSEGCKTCESCGWSEC